MKKPPKNKKENISVAREVHYVLTVKTYHLPDERKMPHKISMVLASKIKKHIKRKQEGLQTFSTISTRLF